MYKKIIKALAFSGMFLGASSAFADQGLFGVGVACYNNDRIVCNSEITIDGLKAQGMDVISHGHVILILSATNNQNPPTLEPGSYAVFNATHTNRQSNEKCVISYAISYPTDGGPIKSDVAVRSGNCTIEKKEITRQGGEIKYRFN